MFISQSCLMSHSCHALGNLRPCKAAPAVQHAGWTTNCGGQLCIQAHSISAISAAKGLTLLDLCQLRFMKLYEANRNSNYVQRKTSFLVQDPAVNEDLAAAGAPSWRITWVFLRAIVQLIKGRHLPLSYNRIIICDARPHDYSSKPLNQV